MVVDKDPILVTSRRPSAALWLIYERLNELQLVFLIAPQGKHDTLKMIIGSVRGHHEVQHELHAK